MAWIWDGIKRLTPDRAFQIIDENLTRLQRALVTPDPFVRLNYGVSITPDASRATYRFFRIGVTNNVAFTINRPIGGQDGAMITIDVVNASGGAMGVITWAAEYLFLHAWVNPAAGVHANATFVKLGGAVDGTWVQIAQ